MYDPIVWCEGVENTYTRKIAPRTFPPLDFLLFLPRSPLSFVLSPGDIGFLNNIHPPRGENKDNMAVFTPQDSSPGRAYESAQRRSLGEVLGSLW